MRERGKNATSGLRRDVLLYYWYKATTATTLYRPVMFLYFRAVGLTWTQIAVLEALGALTTVVSEIPTGYIGDRIGRVNSLILGTTLITVALTAIGAGSSFSTLAACYPLWSLGWNFRSGSDAAWLYDRLAAAGVPDQYAVIRGRGVATASAVGIVGALTGGVLGARTLAWPFLVAAGLTAAGLPPLIAVRSGDSHHDRDRPSPRAAAGIVRSALTNRRLGPFVGYYFVLFVGALAVVFMYAQPAVETLAATIAYDGSVEVLLGGLYAAISVVSTVLSYNTGALTERIGLRRWFGGIPIVVGVGLVGLVAVPALLLPAIVLAHGVADVTETLAGQHVNDQLGGEARATVLSAMRMTSKCAAIPFQLVSGWLVDAGATPIEVLSSVGLLLLFGSLVLGRWTFRRFEPTAG